MKVFSFIKPNSFLPSRPQEDYLLISEKHPIYVVADGVSLNVDENVPYPEHLGAGELAKLFCQAVIQEAEKRYERFQESDLKEVFAAGNATAKEYNASLGRTSETINHWDVDFFAATAALALIKDNKAYIFSLCDSGVVVLDKNGKKAFQSPNDWARVEKNLPADWNDEKDYKKITQKRHQMFRNGINEKGELIGYGAITGEERALDYLSVGTVDVEPGYSILVYTDGFDPYLELKEFREDALKELISKKEQENPEKYGLEKSLIAISV